MNKKLYYLCCLILLAAMPKALIGQVQLGADIDGEAAGDQSGHSVSLSSDGKVLAIGASSNSGNGSGAGHVRVYIFNGTSWSQRGNDIDGEAAVDASGLSVSLSYDGNILAVGAFVNDGNGSDAGHVRVYQWNGSKWTQRGIDIDGEAANDYSGYSVSLSADGNVLAIGALGNDGNGSNSGHARVFSWNGSSWSQRGSDINGESAGDFSGRSVSLSSDGNTIAIGAEGNNNFTGQARIFTWNGTSWTQKGGDIDGKITGERFGWALSLSSDGNTIAISAVIIPDSGRARIYNWNGSS